MGPSCGVLVDTSLAWRCWATDAPHHVQDWRQDPMWCKERVETDLGLCARHREKYRDG